MATTDQRPNLPNGQSAELELEQQYLTRAHELLEAMRQRAEHALAQAKRDAKLTSAPDAAAIEGQLRARIDGLKASKVALAFGRIDYDTNETYYVGRRHVEDEQANPVVVDWRTPVAVAFYRATWAEPLGLDMRRRFALDGPQLAGIFDEDFTDPESHAGGGGVPDPLLAELDRARSGEMRDIVSTIQAEQDEIIRAPFDELVVVQGGPGTGKTAVGLHRAAFLLYEYRKELERTQVLIVGPNKLFLRYISQVLPSLGETSVQQTTVDGLLPGLYRVNRIEPDAEIERIKGGSSMAELIERLIRAKIQIPVEDIELSTGFGIFPLSAQVLSNIINEQLDRDLPISDSRDVIKAKIEQLLWQIYVERPSSDPSSHNAFHDDLRNRKEFKALLDRLWPRTNPVSIVRSILSATPAAVAASKGLMGPDAIRSIKRKVAPKEQDLSRSELAMIDEALCRIQGPPRVFGHVVVDEAQDLSDMELRMIARRSPRRSMTVLGDLAQATTPAGQRSWEHALTVMERRSRIDGTPNISRIENLELGYRVPAQVMDFANRLLATAAPGLRPSRSVRDGGSAPRIVACAASELLEQVVAVANALVGSNATTAVIAPHQLVDGIVAALQRGGLRPVDARKAASLDGNLVVIDAVGAKGLEFDAVCVVEPSEIAGGSAHGQRCLYVALTRAVQELVLVAASPLPEILLDRSPAL